MCDDCLDAIYLHDNTELCINISQMTGGESAVELIRKSWVNRPLETNELTQLSSIAQYD